MKKYEAVIIGAGMTGVTAARRLKKQGRGDILLIDKGRSVGGRMATRRVDAGKADHGAQFFTVRTEELQEEVQNWLEKGWIRHWYGEDYPRYTAVSGMNSLAKQLSEGLECDLETKVIRLEKQEQGYTIFDEEGNTRQADKVLLTMPVPQAVQILKKSDLPLQEKVVRHLSKMSYNPTYVGIFHFNSTTTLPEDGQLDQDLPEGVERLVDHKKKGISTETIVSVYMTGDWSRKYYGEDYVMSMIKEKLESYFDWTDIESEQLKRWHYAQANEMLSASYFDLLGDGTLIAAGDAFLRPDDEAGRTRLESAYLSGRDAAAYLNW